MFDYNTFIVTKADGVVDTERVDGLIMRMINDEISRFEFERAVDSIRHEEGLQDALYQAKALKAIDFMIDEIGLD